MSQAFASIVDPAQATSLARLVDLEACWENMRDNRARLPQATSALQDLQSKRKAYDAFRTKLAVYNKRYKPAHIPELLLNTPSRLGLWCRAMRDLYVQVENDLQGYSPVHLLEKAYGWADRLSVRMTIPLAARSTRPRDIRAAIEDLEVLIRWCDELANVAAPPPSHAIEPGNASA
jgi:hypothetical protein